MSMNDDEKIMRNHYVSNIHQRGQAVLEYVLLLFVVVIVLGGLLFGLADGTRRFVNNYFGAYFQCLLETGELPRLGGDTGGADASECESEFQPFTIEEGRPPILDEGFAGGSDGSEGGGSTPVNVAELEAGSGAEGGAGGSLIPVGSSGDFGDQASGRGVRVPVTSSGSKSSGSSDGNQPPVFMNNATGEDFNENSGRQEYVPVYGRSNSTEEEEREGAPPSVASSGAQGDGEDLRSIKRVPTNTDEKRVQKVDDDTSLSIPDFLRYILIIGMILAIVVFFGGQVLQYQKSKD